MTLANFSLRYPYAIVGIAVLIVGLGTYGFYNTPVELFPPTNPPQVTVITVQAGANDVADQITKVFEKEFNGIAGVNSIRSTSREEVSSITVEFSYERTIQNALVDVQNSIARVRGDLPDEAREPRVYRLDDYTSRPLLTLALRPKNGSHRTMQEVRLLAENTIRDDLLRLQGVADVDVFGGYKPAVRIKLNRNRLAAHDLNLKDVGSVLSRRNISAPAGRIYSKKSEYLLRVDSEFPDLEAIQSLPVKRTTQGEIRVGDLGTVELTYQQPRAAYHGNGKESIALGIVRSINGRTVKTIETIKNELPVLRNRYPSIRFSITQDQQPLIDLNMWGMTFSIIQAIVLTVLVILLFLGDTRAALVVSVTIPLSFLFTLIVLWLSPFTMNMITLTGIIVAIGMVVDAAVVALENIYRHYEERDCSPLEAARSGVSEISLSITAAMLTTVVVLIPLMFMGGYPQRTMGRLSFTIATTLVISLIISLTVIPLASSRLLRGQTETFRPIRRLSGLVDQGLELLEDGYGSLLETALNWRWLTLGVLVILLGLTVRFVVPLIGSELMPPMDTGISNVKFSVPATQSIDRTESVLNEVEDIIRKTKGVQRISAMVGSEPGAISFGTGGATAQSARLIVYLVSRKQRQKSIWEIQSRWRKKIGRVSDVQSVQISAYGATPVATTRAPLDIRISGPDPNRLDEYARKVVKKLQGTPGLVALRRSWYRDSLDQVISVDSSLVRLYKTSSRTISNQLRAAVDGLHSSTFRLKHFLDIPIQLEYSSTQVGTPEAADNVYITSKFGPVPLRTLAKRSVDRTAPVRTRENLKNTIDITGVNKTYTIAQLDKRVSNRLESIQLPEGYELEVGGTTQDMQNTRQRLGKALMIGVIFLFVLLFIMFESLTAPFIVMSIVPFTVGGALWGLLLFDTPLCMPANMGMIFLAGVVVNNSVLMLDFIYQGLERGLDRREAIREALTVRIRPILMTTVSTVVGLSPLVFELAVGLERLSPLAIVASTGLLVGTLLTMIVVPVIYSLFISLADSLKEFILKPS